ncbi:P-loop containing nucleoside triphosphate hydrolase protein [Piedraia hortae CBS 480.64]|uniref:RNA helicase n=1 Tax=Piedraia hortae CBS 480.64 TaxID=1314780 RepID=A0A6A7C4A4_9PEZI|nr:P-loop containing nucleoside triphosphate hydrolase protein [Piedraia hortae CBS 480.64]
MAKIVGLLLCRPWQSVRNASTRVRRNPSRMVLSDQVATGPSKARTHDQRHRNGPFGGGGRNVRRPPKTADGPVRLGKGMDGGRRNSRKEDSRNPMKALKMQRRLIEMPYEKRNRVKQNIQSRDSFDEFDLLPVIKASILRQALGGRTNASPTPIQRLAIPALLGTGRRSEKGQTFNEKHMQQYLLAAETGTGKTLAYSLPIIDAIKRDDISEAENERLSRQQMKKSSMDVESPEVGPQTGRPRAIILVPTAELAEQVGALIKSLAHTVKFRGRMIHAGISSTVIRKRLFETGGVDVLVSTPHLIASIAESNPNVLSRVTHLVVDEADSLLDRSFSPTTSSIIDRASPSLQQLIFCSATIPRSLDAYLQKRYPETRRLATPKLHAIPRHVQLNVIDVDKVPFQGNKDLACAQAIQDITHESEPDRKIIVFVNEREKTVQLAEYLQSRKINAVALSRDSEGRSQAALAAFTGKASEFGNAPSVLVTTDLSSRGVDTLLATHVILYSVPHTTIDFIHRLGRVGRMGRRGRGLVLVDRHSRKDVVREVRECMYRGQALI